MCVYVCVCVCVSAGARDIIFLGEGGAGRASSWTKLRRCLSSSTVVAPGGAAGCGVADWEKMWGTGLS